MALDSPNELRWHKEVISSATEAALGSLQEADLLKNFYLAGGTALALQFGHRLSEDLDFFSEELFDEEVLLHRVRGLPALFVTAKAQHTLHLTVAGTKVSFLGYPYPALFPDRRFMDIAIADARDIACMKITAIASRGTRRDFVDAYFAARKFGLQETLKLFEQKYADTPYNKLHILKSLTYFDDAEKDPMPHLLQPFEWQEAKRFFVDQVLSLK